MGAERIGHEGRVVDRIRRVVTVVKNGHTGQIEQEQMLLRPQASFESI